MPAKGFSGYFLTWNLILSSSAIYEIIQWLGGAYLAVDTAKAFVGAQQDPVGLAKRHGLGGACRFFGAVDRHYPAHHYRT
ncbi:DUF2238 domain-containing protein [Pseudomonas sp. B21-054]|uniref:DUF2238 domain-containing protein n=1 Tax=Pseudomonas sp. B21-054 TaxID=2895494 RepID=UPI002230E785|nr:DUF2238 domain-containing protein [Pseudomonas sp. B21-054]UZE15338.1 DUF2238 domain-containing protein [Pseudomonas sp. B21-054]